MDPQQLRQLDRMLQDQQVARDAASREAWRASGPNLPRPTPEWVRFMTAALPAVPVAIVGGLYVAWFMRSHGMIGTPVIVGWLVGSFVVWGLSTWLLRKAFDCKPLMWLVCWATGGSVVYWIYTSPSAQGIPRVMFTIVAVPLALIVGFAYLPRRLKLITMGAIMTFVAWVYYFGEPVHPSPNASSGPSEKR